VVEFLWKNGITYTEKNVSQDSTAFTEMQRRSNQTKAPVLDWNGKILADFGVDELKPFLREQGATFKDR
jgi:glutaredoxin 3